MPSVRGVSKVSMETVLEAFTISADKRLNGRCSTSKKSGQLEYLHDEALLAVMGVDKEWI